MRYVGAAVAVQIVEDLCAEIDLSFQRFSLCIGGRADPDDINIVTAGARFKFYCGELWPLNQRTALRLNRRRSAWLGRFCPSPGLLAQKPPERCLVREPSFFEVEIGLKSDQRRARRIGVAAVDFVFVEAKFG